MVAYTDGSARPTNPGPNGYGIHGYIFIDEKPKVGTGLKTHYVTSDGYRTDDGEDVTVLNYFEIIGPNKDIDSNNVAEMNGVINALKYANTIEDLKSMTIFCDSKYVLYGIQGGAIDWRNNNWRTTSGSLASNIDHWQSMLMAEEILKAKGVKVFYEKIPAHVGELGNELADCLSNIASNASRNGHEEQIVAVYPSEGFWSNTPDKHPFICYRYMYFNNTIDGSDGKYYTAVSGDVKLEQLLGKRAPETSYSVIRLSNPDLTIKAITDTQQRLSRGNNSFMRLSLDTIFDRDYFRFIDNFGEHSLACTDGKTSSMYVCNKDQVTSERNPPGLLLSAMESLNYLDTALSAFLYLKNGIEDNAFAKGFAMQGMEYFDITNQFYDSSVKMKNKKSTTVMSLKPEIKVGISDITVAIDRTLSERVEKIVIPLILGLDLPPRNNLKRMEVMNPSVYLLSWMDSDQAMRYACVIEAGNDVGIWSNFYCDRIFTVSLIR